MDRDAVLKMFRDAGALLDGHFVLSSGRHSRQYFQAARVFMSPANGERLCRAMVNLLPASLRDQLHYVVAPALGGMLFGYELARTLGCASIFVERDKTGAFALRRGFACAPATPVLIAEDVITTAGSVRETIAVLRAQKAKVLGVACLIDRSQRPIELDVPLYALARLATESFAPDALPADLQARPVAQPGSRPSTKQEVA